MRYAKGIALAVVFLVVAMAASSPADAGVSFGYFQSSLNPHGSWFVSAQYGRVWQPRVYAAGWNPYYDGHWAYTDVGYSWVSDYPWGGIPYHYGTWVADPFYGWVWVPGYTWAPSWVVFRTGPDFVGWAPVAPGFSVGVSFGAPVLSTFVFVPSHSFFAPHIRSCAFHYGHSRGWADFSRSTVVNNIRVENNVVVNRGPDSRWVQRATGRRLQPERIERVANSGWAGHARRDEIRLSPEVARRGVRAAEPMRDAGAMGSRGADHRSGWARSSAAGSAPAMEPRRSQGRTAVMESRPSRGRTVTSEPRVRGGDRVGGERIGRTPERSAGVTTSGRRSGAAPRQFTPETFSPRTHVQGRSHPAAPRAPVMQRGGQGGAPQVSKGATARGGSRETVTRSGRGKGRGKNDGRQKQS